MIGRLIYALAVGMFIAALAGCGGSGGNVNVTQSGGGASATNTPNQPTNSPVTTTTTP